MALDDLRVAARLIRSHHERFDGMGYPDGLGGPAIPLGARILAVANDYDALQIGSFCAKRLTAEEARAFVQQSRGKRYDPQVVDAFLALQGGEGAGGGAPPGRELLLGPENLKPGMVLSRDLISRDGVLLLAADFVLDEGLIKQISDFASSEEVRIVIHVRADKQLAQ